MTQANGSAKGRQRHADFSIVSEPDEFGRRTIGFAVDGVECHRDLFNPDSAAACDKFADGLRDVAPYEFVAWACRKALNLNDDQHTLERETPFRKWIRAKLLERLNKQASGVDTDDSTFPMQSCTDLAATDFKVTYLIDGLIVEHQPALFCGPRKGLKTSFLAALAWSLAMAQDDGTTEDQTPAAGPYLGRFRVPSPRRVAFFSGESGLATLWDTFERIAAADGAFAVDAGDKITVCELLPQLDDPSSLRKLARTTKAVGATVVIVDPAYMAMPGGDAGNLFAQGALLRALNETCLEVGATAILAHHSKKNIANPFAPGELDDIAWAGFQEFARQWILTSRRQLYIPGTGEHRLWLSYGGSAGHSGLYGVDLDEGSYVPGQQRQWSINLITPDECREAAADGKDAQKEALALEKIERHKKAICKGAMKLQDRAGTFTDIRGRSGVSPNPFAIAFAELLEAGDFVEVEIVKGNNRKFPGYGLVTDEK